MAPVLEELQEIYAGRVDVLKVNADESQPLVKRLGVLGVGCTLRAGAVVDMGDIESDTFTFEQKKERGGVEAAGEGEQVAAAAKMRQCRRVKHAR